MKSPSNFGRLVRGCMDSYDSNQIVIFAGFFEIYKIFILLQRSDLNNSVKKTHARTHARTGQPDRTTEKTGSILPLCSWIVEALS